MLRLDPPVALAADVHLSPAVPARGELFAAFLRGPARTARTLCILGDLFDAWTGDDDSSAFAEAIRGELRALTGDGNGVGGTRVVVIRGNRDFLLGARFAAETGCEVLTADATAAELGGVKVLLAHGDAWLDDPGYLRYRRLVRGAAFAKLAAALPGGWRMRMARGMRNMSRGGKTAKKKTDGKTGGSAAGEFVFNYAAAEAELRRTGCAVAAHGHFHRRIDEEWTGVDGAKFRRLCLPDWTGEAGPPGYAEVAPNGAWTPRDFP